MLSNEITVENGMVRRKTEDASVLLKTPRDDIKENFKKGISLQENIKKVEKEYDQKLNESDLNYAKVLYLEGGKIKDAELSQGDYEEYKGWHIIKSNVPGKYMAESPKGGTIFDYSVSNLKKKIDSQTKDGLSNAVKSGEYKGVTWWVEKRPVTYYGFTTLKGALFSIAEDVTVQSVIDQIRWYIDKNKKNSQTKDASTLVENYKGKQIKKDYDGKFEIWNGNVTEFANIQSLERAKQIIDNPAEAKKIGTGDRKTKDDWSEEARKKALEARRANAKGNEKESAGQRQPKKQETQMSKHTSTTPAKEVSVDPKNIKNPNSLLRQWFNVNTLKKKQIKIVKPYVNENGEEVPGKTEWSSATLYKGTLKSGINKGKEYCYAVSSGYGRPEMAGFMSNETWGKVTETMHEDDVESQLGLKEFER